MRELAVPEWLGPRGYEDGTVEEETGMGTRGEWRWKWGGGGDECSGEGEGLSSTVR